MTEKMMVYALGRGVEYYDAPTIRRIALDAATGGYRFSRIVLGIVNSPAFLMRAPMAPAVGPETKSASAAAPAAGRSN
jgi:hypothetical protein